MTVQISIENHKHCAGTRHSGAVLRFFESDG